MPNRAREQRAMRGAAWAAAGRWLQLVISIVAITLIARVAGPEAFGVYTLARLIVGVAGVALEGPICESLIASPKLTRGHTNALFGLCLAIAFVVWALVWLFAGPLAAVFDVPSLVQILPVLGLCLIGMALSGPPAALLMREMKYREFAIVENGSSMVSALIGSGMALAGYGVWSLVWMEISRLTLRAILALWYAGYRPGLDGDWRDFAEHGRFTLNVTGGSALLFLEVTAPRVIVGLVFGERALGYYALALRLAWQVFALVIQPFSAVATASTRETRTNQDDLERFMITGASASGVVAYPAFVGIAAVCPILLPFAFGPEWAAAVIPVQIVMLAGLRVSPIQFFLGVLRGLGKSAPDFIVALVGTITTLVLTVLAIPFGLIAVAGAYLARNLLVWPLVGLFVRQHAKLPLRRFLTLDLAPVCASLIMGVLVALAVAVMPPTWPSAMAMLAAMAFGAVVYAAALFAISPSLVQNGLGMARSMVSKSATTVPAEAPARADAADPADA